MALHKDGEEVSDREPPTLFELSGAVVSRIMGRVEKEVWGKMMISSSGLPIPV